MPCFFCRRCSNCKCATLENETSWRCGELVRRELAALRKAIAAAEAMREDTCLGDAQEAFDAAMAEVRKGG